MLTHPVGFFGARGYSANAVRFDGSNDYLTRGADLTSNADTKLLIISFWFNMKGSDGVDQYFYINANTTSRVEKENNDKIRVLFQDSGFVSRLHLVTTDTYVASGGWVHFLASCNLNTPVAHLYVNDADAEAGGATESDGNMDNADSNHGIGGSVSGGNKIDADIADFYINFGEYLDLTSTANRRKFIDGDGKPVDLGSDGSEPTGTAPKIFLSGDTATWHTNKGGGGGFTESGALTDGASSPSD